MSTTYDWLILSAANRAQARGFRAALHDGEETGKLGACRNWMVVPDAGGARIGSGASTLLSLWRIGTRMLRCGHEAASIADLFGQVRLLLVHCGGDGRRLPVYGATGKSFAPLPCRCGGLPATLLDLVLEDMASLPQLAGGGVVVASGDVYLDAAGHLGDLGHGGITGVAWPAGMETAAHHGVYVADTDGRVRNFLQKPTEEEARTRGAIDDDGRLLVDTGLIALHPSAIERWLTIGGVVLRDGRLHLQDGPLRTALAEGTCLDLYGQMLTAISPGSNLPWMEEIDFTLRVIPTTPFLHLGTTQQLLERLRHDVAPVGGHAFRARTAAIAPNGVPPTATLINSHISGDVSIGEDVLVEGSARDGALHLAGRNVLVGLPGSAIEPVSLKQGWGLVCLPVDERDWVAVRFGIDDDFKSPLHAGGTLGNSPLQDILDQAGVSAADLWSEGQEQSLFAARLWPVGAIDDVLAATAWISLGEGPSKQWRSAQRLDMADIAQRINHHRLLQRRADLQEQVRSVPAEDRLIGDCWLSTTDVLSDLADPATTLDRLAAADGPPLARARLSQVASRLAASLGDDRASSLGDAALAAVAELVPKSSASQPRPMTLDVDESVTATAPLRIDLAGGWSDTPPICMELGGAVLNTAITLDGRRPVRVRVRRLEEPVLSLASADLDRRDAWDDRVEVADWNAIAVAALRATGLAPPGNEPLAPWLASCGGGIELEFEAAAPSGSGLGTSSILAAAILAALGELVGERWQWRSLVATTSAVEQAIGAGGGWQDQVGALHGGFKLAQSSPGIGQELSLTTIDVPSTANEELAQRCLLFYTGYQRRAANILHPIVRRWLDRGDGMLRTVDGLRLGAMRMAEDLAAGDVDAFADGVGEYWQLKQQIDAGSCDERIGALVGAVAPYARACTLAGAGGGGYLFIVADDRDAAAAALAAAPSGESAAICPFAIDRDGLQVRVGANPSR